MKLVNLHIDRFGARSQLELPELSDRLNVIYGPNGAGKTTIIQFLRWMLFGQTDEYSRRYLATGSIPAGGSLDIRDARGIRHIQRTDASGCVAPVVFGAGDVSSARPTVRLVQEQFDSIFCLSFDQPRDLTRLLRTAETQGLQLRYDQRQLDRIQQLTDHIDQHRRELSELGFTSGSTESLLQRRADLRQRIESIRLELRRDREQLQRELEHVASQIVQHQAVVERHRRIVGDIDAGIEHRRRQLAEEYQDWAAARDESVERRDQHAAELDRQINRWREILAEVGRRAEEVRGRMVAHGDQQMSADESADVQLFLRSLGFRIRNLEHDLDPIHGVHETRDFQADATYYRDLLQSTLHTVSDETSRLNQVVQRQHAACEIQNCREELNYLQRCERELADLIEALERRRQPANRGWDYDWPETLESEFSPRGLSDPEFALSLDSAVHDFRLRHLVDRRDAAVGQLRDVESQLAGLRREQEQLETRLRHLSPEGGVVAGHEREIKDIEQLLARLRRQESLQRTIDTLEDEVRRLRQQLGSSRIIDDAADMLRRLTDMQYTALKVTPDFHCQVTRRDGEVVHYHQLSRGVRDQVYLSLCLAMAAARRDRQEELPIILNDIFVNMDNSATRALADVLVDFANRGHQVLVFTRHQHIVDQFQARAAWIFSLREKRSDARPVASATPPVATPRLVSELPPPPTQEPTYRWVAEWQREQPVTPSPAFPHSPQAPGPADTPTRRDNQDDRRPPASGLSGHRLLSEVPTLVPELVAYLRELGVRRVDEFLKLDPRQAAERLKGRGITPEIIQRRQRELLLMIHVAVTPLEAQLLVTCGVPDPERLGRADEGVLLRRIETILQRPQAVERFGPLSDYSLELVREWIRGARQSEYQARSTYRSADADAPRRRDARRSASQDGNGKAPARQTVPIPSPESLRFYLELSDDVVDAPSIGPKTTELLNEIDVFTVADLLNANPDDVAARLGDRRVTPQSVSQWQLQARLVCRIPNLRGHDAQILVACGIEDPSELVTRDARKLLEQVTRFVDTKEGQRILRNGKRPDLTEVTSWIHCAESARQLRAA